MLLLISSFMASNTVAANTVVYYGSMNSKINCENLVGLRRSRSKQALCALYGNLFIPGADVHVVHKGEFNRERVFQVRNEFRWPSPSPCALYPSEQTGHHKQHSCHSCLCGQPVRRRKQLEICKVPNCNMSKILSNSTMPGEFFNS